MRATENRIRFSPSDLSAFLACEHLTSLEVRAARGEIDRPDSADDPTAELIRRKGEEHEARYLDGLHAAGKTVATVELLPDFDWERASRETEEAIRSGADVVYQACLVDGDWRGFADFLERLPDGSYEVVDTKLARHPKPAHLFQLCFYSLVVGRLQGRPPREMHLVTGDGERHSFRVEDYLAYYRRIRDRFLAFAAEPPETEPYPVAHCGLCGWRERCEAWWRDTDHLVQVANISRKQIERLVGAGVGTLEELAERAPEEVQGIAADVLERLRHQALLQLVHRRTGEHRVDTLPLAEQRGFALLPPPDRADVYFDIEGDPFYSPDGSLEYLFGVAYRDESGKAEFRAFWGHDEAEEKLAFEQLVDWLRSRRAAHPGMHVYHYASYERSALQRLMQKHGTREDEVDDLLRRHVLVDLFQVVRQALRISLPSYSLKKVEELYFPERQTDVLGGEESTVVFEQWLESGDDALLRQIEAYNRDDCLSTLALHEWLLGLRPPGLPWAEPPPERMESEEAAERRTERELVQARLREQGETLAADLLDFHRRDAKPAWWDWFRRLTLDRRELIEDPEAIGAIEPTDEPLGEVAQSFVYTLEFPPQEFKVGSEAIDPRTGHSPGQILSIDETTGRIRLKRSKKRHGEPLPEAFVPPEPLPTWEQRAALLRLGRALADGGHEYGAAREILARRPPPARLDAGPLEAARSLEGGHLFVQGPPGSGKTWLGAELAVELIRDGRRVGVAAQSHKAIHKFLDDVVWWAGEKGVSLRGLKKSSGFEATRYEASGLIENCDERKAFVGDGHDLIAGTSFLFAWEPVQVDTLFVDEAGQVSLADALAMATSARNVVLLGDPNQLPQVSQGAQPREVRASVLEHLLGDDVTVPPERGIFLERTWRLRPELCRFVSDAFYEGRLEPAPVCAERWLDAGVGLRFVELEHTGNKQRSVEEARWVAEEIERLLGTTFRDADGSTRPLEPTDVLVVAPYNMHVRSLRGAVPEGVAVGTVDKFQGQQAPVVFFSMATSSGEEAPRGLEFLFSANRVNVAVSRAQCLAYVVASPRLLVADARTPEQMRLVNNVCRFAEAAAG